MYVVVLRNGPLLGRCYCLTGPYLLFICPTCLVIALEPRRAQVLPLLPPPWPSPVCAASVSCVMGHEEWLCCCCICCCCSPEAKKNWLCATSTSTHAAAAAAAFSSLLLPLLRLSLLPCLLGGPAALVAAPHVPTTPMFLFERNIVLRNTNSCFTCSLFKQKALHGKHTRSCFPALLAWCIKNKGKRALRQKKRGMSPSAFPSPAARSASRSSSASVRRTL